MYNASSFNEKEKEMIEKFINAAFERTGALMHFPVRNVEDPAVLSAIQNVIKCRHISPYVLTFDRPWCTDPSLSGFSEPVSP